MWYVPCVACNAGVGTVVVVSVVVIAFVMSAVVVVVVVVMSLDRHACESGLTRRDWLRWFVW